MNVNLAGLWQLERNQSAQYHHGTNWKEWNVATGVHSETEKHVSNNGTDSTGYVLGAERCRPHRRWIELGASATEWIERQNADTTK